MASSGGGWTLVGFTERLETWEKNEAIPVGDLKLIVVDWIMSRHTDPYAGVAREPGFPNLWFGPIPNTLYGDGLVVCCSYFIDETSGIVRCDSIASLSCPV